VRDGAFDGVTAHSYLYLVPDPVSALAEARRAHRPGGRLALLEPRDGPLALAGALSCGARGAASMLLWRTMSRLHRRFTEADLASLLDAAGFAEVRAWPALGGFGVMATGLRAAGRPSAG
jgi:SAM-dependent methyltransferase